jgi:hypothetical protein
MFMAKVSRTIFLWYRGTEVRTGCECAQRVQVNSVVENNNIGIETTHSILKNWIQNQTGLLVKPIHINLEINQTTQI